MTLKPDTEALLREFLDGGWREGLADHELADQKRHAELLSDHKVTSLRIGDLEERADKLEDRNEETGRHQVVRLEAALADTQKNHTAGARYWVTTAIGVLFGVAGLINIIVSLTRK